MNQKLGRLDGLNGHELRRALVDELLANASTGAINVAELRDPATKELVKGVGWGKISWEINKWTLHYDLKSLEQTRRMHLLPYIKEFYALFEAIEFYPAITNDLIESFVDNIPKEYQLEFVQIMLDDLERTKNQHISGENKLEAKERIIAAYEKFIKTYWEEDTVEVEAIGTGTRGQVLDTFEATDAAQ